MNDLLFKIQAIGDLWEIAEGKYLVFGSLNKNNMPIMPPMGMGGLPHQNNAKNEEIFFI